MKRVDQRERSQKFIRTMMVLCIVVAFACMIYATLAKCSWKTNLAVVTAIFLILAGGLLKLQFDRNEVKYYNN